MTSTGQWWLHPLRDWGILKMYRYPFAYDVYMLSNEHGNKILRCKHIPWITVVFCWRKCNIKRRHPGDPRSYRSVGISQSQCRREGEFRMHHQAPDYREKKRGFESHPEHPFCKWKGWSDEEWQNQIFYFLKQQVRSESSDMSLDPVFFVAPWPLIAFLKQFASSEGFITVRTLQREVSIFNR